MDAVVILRELDFRGVEVMSLHEPIQEMDVIALVSGGGDLQVALIRVDIISQQDITNPFSDVLLLFFLGGPELGW